MSSHYVEGMLEAATIVDEFWQHGVPVQEFAARLRLIARQRATPATIEEMNAMMAELPWRE